MLLTLAVAVIPLVLAGFRIIKINQEAQITSVLEGHNQRASEIAQIIGENYVGNWLKSIGTVSATQQLYNMPTKERQALISALVNEYDDLEALLLYDTTGELIISAFEEDVFQKIVEEENLLEELIFHDNENLIQQSQIQDVVFGESYTSEIMNSLYVSIAMKTPLGNNREGILIGKISLKNLQELIINRKIGKRGEVYVVNRDGELIAHRNSDLLLKNVSENPMVQTFIQAPLLSSSEPFIGQNGMEMLGAYSSVERINWGVIIEEPKEDAYLAVNQMRNNLIFWFFVAAIISIIGAMFLSRRITNPISHVAEGAHEIARGNFDYRIESYGNRKDEIGQLTASFNNMATSLKEKEQIKGAFSKFVPPLVVEEILNDLDNLHLGGTRRKVAVMFVDIRGFTSISEKLPAENVVDILNTFLENMTKIVFKYQGTLDKFLGDGFMAFWGAPISHEDDVLRSAKAAIDMLESMEPLKKFCSEKYDFAMNIGIGIHYGEAIVGNAGTDMRMEFTAIGDTVNTASRFCSIAKPGQIIISQSLLSEIEEHAVYDDLPPVKLKGKEHKVAVFNLKEIV
jgi:adenylate cyclase